MAGKADGGKSENRASEEDEPFGNHVDKGGDGGGNGGGGIGFGAKSGPEEETTNGDERPADVFDDAVHDFEELGVGGFDSVGFLFEFSEGVVGADVLDSSVGGTCDDETAGI